MTQEAAEILQHYGDGALDIRSNYSGRSMYGRRTFAVTGSYNAVFTAIARVMSDGSDEEREEIAEFLPELDSDCMGLEFVFY